MDKRENFQTAIQRAITSCETTGYEPNDHFRGITKMVKLGSATERSIDDFMLTRYACHLFAQNGDPRNEPIIFAQSYFAIQTRKPWLSRRLYFHIKASGSLISKFTLCSTIRIMSTDSPAPPLERFCRFHKTPSKTLALNYF